MSFLWVELGEICDLKNGYAFKSKDYVESSNTLSCRMSNVRPGGIFDINYNARFLPDDFAEKHSDFLLADNDVVIAMTDLADSPKILGVPTVVKTNGKNILLNQRVGKLVIKDRNKVYVPYLKLALNYPKIRVVYKKFAGGGLQINLGKADLLSVKIPLPPLKEQKRIAAILDKADAIRRKRQQAIDLTDQLLRSVFLELFGDPVTNPKGYKVGKIEDLLSSVNYGTSAKADEEGEYPILRMNNITYEGTWNLKKLKYLDMDEKERKKYTAEPGDILFNRTNSKELVGKTAVFREKDPYIFAGYLVRSKVNSLAEPEYISSFLNSKYGKTVLRHMCKSIVGMANINAKEYQSIKILIPPISQQQKYASIVKKCERDLESYKQSLSKCENLFSSLTQQAFNGELSKQTKAA